MPDIDHNPEKHLPLTPAVFHILLALTGSEKHGYAIMREVEATTEGRRVLGPGTLYGAIKRLLQVGLIAEVDERPDPTLDDSRRRYYELTDFGQKVLMAETERLDRMVEAARRRDLLGVETPRQEAKP